jgi:hypothetical protein
MRRSTYRMRGATEIQIVLLLSLTAVIVAGLAVLALRVIS